MPAQAATPATISVITVTYRQGEAVRPALDAVVAQLGAGDELIVADNDSGDDTPAVVRSAAPGATLIETGANLGFAAACNRAAATAGGELLIFLNPDAVPAPGWRDAIAGPLGDGSGWSAWQGLVTAASGRLVNTRGGVVHFTGIAWAGGAGEPISSVRENGVEPGFASGACFAIPRARFLELGGFAEAFFLYHEDVDLSLRIRLAGGRLGVATGARVDHEYEFDKGPAKWRYLERNRWATLLRVYPASLLWLLTPALAATELALIPASIAGGWFGQKLRAWGDTFQALPRLARERRTVQATRRVGAAEFARGLTPALDSPFLGAASSSKLLNGLLAGYWRLVLRLLGA